VVNIFFMVLSSNNANAFAGMHVSLRQGAIAPRPVMGKAARKVTPGSGDASKSRALSRIENGRLTRVRGEVTR
jgi:hypothetical protein